MDLEGIVLSEVSQAEKDKYHVIPFICGISKTKQRNTQKTETDSTDTENKQGLARGESVGNMGEIGEGD